MASRKELGGVSSPIKTHCVGKASWNAMQCQIEDHLAEIHGLCRELQRSTGPAQDIDDFNYYQQVIAGNVEATMRDFPADADWIYRGQKTPTEYRYHVLTSQGMRTTCAAYDIPLPRDPVVTGVNTRVTQIRPPSHKRR